MTNRLNALTVGAVAMATTLLAAPPAAAGPTATSALPTVTAGALSRLVPYNRAAGVTFTVKIGTKPLIRRAVQTCTAPVDGDWVCVNATTNAAGKVWTLRPNVTAPVRVKAVVPLSTGSEPVTSDTVLVTPQVGVSVARRATTMTVTVTVVADQYLLVKRKERASWVFDRVQRAVGPTTTMTGLVKGKTYQVIITDTPTIEGNVSRPV